MYGGSSFLAGYLFILEDLHHYVLVDHCDSIVEVGLVAFGSRFELGSHRDLDLRALGVALVRLHVDKIDELYLLARLYGDDDGAYCAAELFFELLENAVEVRLAVVVFIDEEHLGNVDLGSIVPCQLGADLDAGLCIDEYDRASRNAQSLFDLTDKIKVAGSVENVYLAALPDDGRDSCRYGKFSLDLFGVEVADSISVGSFAESVGTAADVKHCLGK